MNTKKNYDENFVHEKLNDCDFIFCNVLDGDFEIGGLAFQEENDDAFLRLPIVKSHLLRKDLMTVATFNTGASVRFITDSKKIAIKATLLNEMDLDFMPRSGMSGIDIYIGSEKDKTFVYNIDCQLGDHNLSGIVNISNQSEASTEVIVYFPLYNTLTNLQIGVEENAYINKPMQKSIKKNIVFYGSSITQGGCVQRPGLTYVNMLGRWLDAPVINLGFGGNAWGDFEVAKIIGRIDTGMIVYDYDHNAPTPSHLNETHYSFYEILRKHHKDIPIIMITRPDATANEYVENRKIIYESYQKAMANGDENVYFIDGSTLFGDFGRDECTVDLCHPNSLGSYRMAVGIYKVIADILCLDERLF